ncbi:MAG: enoyl-CoA hydratase-related protein, partial [Chloroflexota bacterium]|nr:enoyl-CoA hydratase-related protein [Chloroflexota bacterium]
MLEQKAVRSINLSHSGPYEPAFLRPPALHMNFETLTFDVRDRIATITVNRPDKLNALNDATIGELGDAIGLVLSREDIGGALVTGAGAKAFAAGADIAELATQGPIDGRARSRRAQRI